MVSVITDRVNGAASPAPVAGGGGGIYTATNVAGTNTVTADLSPATNQGYKLNQMVFIRPVILNTGPVQVNFDEGGLVDLLSPNGSALSAGQFDPALEYLVKFNGTEFRIVTPSF